MINNFFYEFLLHPSPIEYSGGRCNYNCEYCFVKLRGVKVDGSFKSCIRKIINQNNSNDLTSYYLKNKYPICLSNRTEPFSSVNINETISICETLNKNGNPVFFQTKGTTIKNIDEILNATKNIKKFFYVTITTLNESKRKIIEPNTPTTNEKIDFIKYLKSKNKFIIIAVNPLAKELITKEEIKSLSNELNIQNVIIEAIHYNKREPYKSNIIDTSITQIDRHIYCSEVIKYLIKENIHPVKIGMPYHTYLFDKMREHTNIMPVYADFINYALKNPKKEFTFEDYILSMNINKYLLFENLQYIDKYILFANIHGWKGNKDKIKCFNDVFKFIWDNKIFKQSPQNNIIFERLNCNDTVLKIKEKIEINKKKHYIADYFYY